MQKIYLKFKDHWLFWFATLIIGALLSKIFSTINFDAHSYLEFLFRIINIRIPIFGFLLGAVVVLIVNNVYKKYFLFLFKNRKLKILKAEYGIDDKFIDITSDLNESIEQDKLKIILSNNIAGDPYKGKIKMGKIKYQFKDKEENVDYKEGDLIELPR